MSAILELRAAIPNEVFEDKDLKLVLRHLSGSARISLLKRLIKKNDLLRVSRGVYAFGEPWRKKGLSQFTIANHLYSPSYVSYHSALSHHGLIPEAVYTTTSACVQQKIKHYKTPFGDFTYDHVPINAFRLGVVHENLGHGFILMATPIKALFDMIYFYRKDYKTLENLEQDLRVDLDDLSHFVKNEKYQDLEILAKAYRKKNCLNFFQVLIKELK